MCNFTVVCKLHITFTTHNIITIMPTKGDDTFSLGLIGDILPKMLTKKGSLKQAHFSAHFLFLHQLWATMNHGETQIHAKYTPGQK